MIKNYLMTALRIMIRHRGYSIINLSGLTIGITCSLLIILYIYDETSYDRFHPDAKRIFRIGFSGKIQENKFNSAQTGAPLASTLQREVPEIESVIRIASWATFPVRYENKAFTEKNMLLGDSNFFNFFNFTLLAGDPQKVLDGPRNIVITEEAARRYFGYTGLGDPTPLGKTLVLAQGYTAKVTGIAADPPDQSHFHFSFVLSLDSWEELDSTGWTERKVNTYFKLKPGQQLTSVTDKFDQLIETYVGRELKQFHHTDFRQFREQGNNLAFFVQPLTSIHLTSHLSEEIESNGDVQYVYMLGTIAVFITLLACINFMNLSTARSANRAREVGVRKSVGALPSRLMFQFLLESFIYTILSVLIALIIIWIVLVPFNVLVEKQLTMSVLKNPLVITGIIVFILLVGLSAGSYPAFYLASFNPIEILKSRVRTKFRRYGIRNILVIFQFFISIGLIISTLTVYKQLIHLQRVNLGFSKDNIINLLHTRNLGQQALPFKEALLQDRSIISASYANRLPPNIDWQAVFRPVDSSEDFLLTVYEMDYEHLETMGYTMSKGRFFDRSIPSDSSALILNETAARKLGLENFEGKKIISHYDQQIGKERTVIGIIHDFNFQSLKHPIQPMAVILGNQPNWEMAIRLAGSYTEEKIRDIETLWKKFAPGAPFEYTVLDRNFTDTMQAEKKIGRIFLLFTSLAIFIASLGLYGLATYTAVYRSKEIGIRKAMGATTNQLIILLSKDFTKLVLIAFLLAIPVCLYLLNRWLHQFAYHVHVDVGIILIAGLSALSIALITISYQAFKTALANPVDSLRDE